MEAERAVRLSDLQGMSEAQRESVLGMLLKHARAPADGRVAELDARIAEFERRYELPSTEMVTEVESGIRKETDDIASWLMLLKVRKRVADYQPG
jgi:hypothetical protein